MSAVALRLVARYLELGVVADFLWANLEAQGPLSGKGRTRAALTAYLGVVDREMKAAEKLGMARRPKPVETPLDYMRGRVEP